MSALTPDGRSPQQQLNEIDRRLKPLVARQHQNFDLQLRPQLAKIGVDLLNYADLDQEQRL